MINKIKKLILILSLSLFPVLIPVLAHAALDCTLPSLTAKEAIECGTKGASGIGQDPSNAASHIDNSINKFVNVFSAIIGIIASIMIVAAGFKYITSGGNTEKVGQAKNTILYAVIGLVVVAMAQVIAKYVVTQAT